MNSLIELIRDDLGPRCYIGPHVHNPNGNYYGAVASPYLMSELDRLLAVLWWIP